MLGGVASWLVFGLWSPVTTLSTVIRLPCQLPKHDASSVLRFCWEGRRLLSPRNQNPRDYMGRNVLNGPPVVVAKELGWPYSSSLGPPHTRPTKPIAPACSCRHREILKGMLAIFCKSRPPSQSPHPAPTKRRG